MRKTIGDTKEALEFQAKIDTLSQPARDHFRLVLLKLIDCYTDDETHGVLVMHKDGQTGYQIVAINADEMTAAGLLHEACGALAEVNSYDKPELLN